MASFQIDLGDFSDQDWVPLIPASLLGAVYTFCSIPINEAKDYVAVAGFGIAIGYVAKWSASFGRAANDVVGGFFDVWQEPEGTRGFGWWSGAITGSVIAGSVLISQWNGTHHEATRPTACAPQSPEQSPVAKNMVKPKEMTLN